MNYYGLHGKLQATVGNGPRLADILLKASRLVASAPGCRLYLVSQDPQNSDAVWITEAWDSQEDHDRSLEISGVRELIGRAMPLLDGPPQPGQQLTVLGGFGL